jgi:hypothetical protein
MCVHAARTYHSLDINSTSDLRTMTTYAIERHHRIVLRRALESNQLKAAVKLPGFAVTLLNAAAKAGNREAALALIRMGAKVTNLTIKLAVPNERDPTLVLSLLEEVAPKRVTAGLVHDTARVKALLKKMSWTPFDLFNLAGTTKPICSSVEQLIGQLTTWVWGKQRRPRMLRSCNT